PYLLDMVGRCRKRILDIELKRGDLPTVVTQAALCLRWTGGADTLFRTLAAMGSTAFVRGWTQHGESRSSVFSHIIKATYPGEDDTPERFAELARESKIKEKRLIEVAAFAPQWAECVETAVGLSGLAEGIWWIHAHTKDDQWSVEQELREAWQAEVASRT